MAENNFISVTVKLFAGLNENGPNKSEAILQEGSTINSILEKYNISKKKKLIILVNRIPHYDRDFILKNNSTIAIFPPLGGG